LGPGSKDSKTRGDADETLENPRGRRELSTPADRRALDLMLVKTSGGSGPAKARRARRLPRASPPHRPEPPEKGSHEFDGALCSPKPDDGRPDPGFNRIPRSK